MHGPIVVFWMGNKLDRSGRFAYGQSRDNDLSHTYDDSNGRYDMATLMPCTQAITLINKSGIVNHNRYLFIYEARHVRRKKEKNQGVDSQHKKEKEQTVVTIY